MRSLWITAAFLAVSCLLSAAHGADVDGNSDNHGNSYQVDPLHALGGSCNCALKNSDLGRCCEKDITPYVNLWADYCSTLPPVGACRLGCRGGKLGCGGCCGPGWFCHRRGNCCCKGVMHKLGCCDDAGCDSCSCEQGNADSESSSSPSEEDVPAAPNDWDELGDQDDPAAAPPAPEPQDAAMGNDRSPSIDSLELEDDVLEGDVLEGEDDVVGTAIQAAPSRVSPPSPAPNMIEDESVNPAGFRWLKAISKGFSKQ